MSRQNDTGICGHCNKEFDIKQYGYRISCPHCKKHNDVFPDQPQVFVFLADGTRIGIAFQKGFIAGWVSDSFRFAISSLTAPFTKKTQ